MRKKTLDEKIQEELKYSEYLNNKINQISKKTKDKKKQIKRNQNTFDFINEFFYLKDQQKKIENELVVQLYDVSSKENDEILRDFYYMMKLERDISSEFKTILNLVKDALKNHKTKKINKDGINKLFDTLKAFDKNLITLSENDFKLLINQENEDIVNKNNNNNNNDISQDESQLNKSNITNSTNYDNNLDLIDLLFMNDISNNFGINDINFIINQEIYQEEKTKSLIIPYKHNETKINNSSKKKIKDIYLSLPISPYQVNPQLKERLFLILGENQGNQVLLNIEKTFELTNMKYKKDYENLKKELMNQLQKINKSNIPIEIKLQTSNMNYFIRHFNNSQSITKMLTNINITNKNKITLYTTYSDFLDFIYNFKKNTQALIISYNDEINELKTTTIKLINQEIINETQLIKEKVEKYEFNQRKKELDKEHQKNKEIYEMKQKLKKEREELDEKLKQKLEREKNEKNQQRHMINKLKVEEYLERKKDENIKAMEKAKKEEELLKKKTREEINKKLPIIIQNHINSTEKFIINQRHKELMKKQQELNERRLNYIIENYKDRPKVEADPERLVSITKNLEHRYESIMNGIPDKDEKVQLFTNNGYTVENLMKDFRYKVSSALYEAGIIGTQASKDLLLQINNANASNFNMSNINI